MRSAALRSVALRSAHLACSLLVKRTPTFLSLFESLGSWNGYHNLESCKLQHLTIKIKHLRLYYHYTFLNHYELL